MLADNRSEALVTNFAAQWLYLRDIEAKQPDEILFPEFDTTLREALRQETELFLSSVFRENRSVLELLSANYTFLNERLAQHYGDSRRAQGKLLPPLHVSPGQPCAGASRTGELLDDYLVCQPHVAGPAGQVWVLQKTCWLSPTSAASAERPVIEDGRQ